MGQTTTTRVGPALRTVRTQRGLSLDEAARDTRIRREFLEALENEDFERLLGDVHVRGCLRTYASYLRLSPDKVVAAYAPVATQEPIPTPLPGALPREPALGRPRHRDNHRLIVLVAATVLVLAAAFGVLSARNNAPAPAELDTNASAGAAEDGAAVDRSISIGVIATQDVRATVTIDATAPRTYQLEAGEGRSFEAHERLTIALSDGGAAEISLSGADPEVPGRAGEPWEETYTFGS